MGRGKRRGQTDAEMHELHGQSAEDLKLLSRADQARREGRTAEARRIAEALLDRAPALHVARVTLALTLLELEETQAASRQLERFLDPLVSQPGPQVEGSANSARDSNVEQPSVSPLAGLGEAWVPEGKAFQSDAERGQEAAGAETVKRSRSRAGSDSVFALGRSSAFATQTMAGLLDRQGDHTRADVIREHLDDSGVVLEAASEPTSLPVPAPALTPKPKESPLPDALSSVMEPSSFEDCPQSSPPESTVEPESSDRVLETLDAWLENVQRGRA